MVIILDENVNKNLTLEEAKSKKPYCLFKNMKIYVKWSIGYVKRKKYKINLILLFH